MSKIMTYAKEMATHIIANQNNAKNNANPVKIETEFYDKGVNVTDQITEVYDEQRHGLQWEKFDITNNGPDPVYFSVNKWESPEAPLIAGLTIHVDYKDKGLINRVYLRCDIGNRANVSFFVMRKV